MANTNSNTSNNGKRNSGKTEINGEMIPDVANDTGLLTVQRATAGAESTFGMREVMLNIHNTLIDRYEGTTSTEPIWGEKANIRVIQTAAVDANIREFCSRFFISRMVRNVIINIIPTHTVRPVEVMISKPELWEALVKVTPSAVAANAIMEILVPYLTKVGVLSKNGDYSMRFEYPVGPVTIDAIARDVAAFEIVRVMEKTKVVNIADRKYSKEVFADEVSDALYEVGRAFLDTNSLGNVIDDIVKGVRAHIDLENTGLLGMVDPSWRDNDVVATLAGNWVFVEAALNIPTGTSISPTNEGWKLDQNAPGILAAIKSSQRYAVVGRSEAIRNIGTRKIRNNRGVPVSVVLFRAANPDAVGMSVYAYEDSVMSGAYTLTHTKERLGEVVAAAYNNPAELGTVGAAKRLVSTLTDVAQSGYTGLAAMYQIDIGGYAFVENRMIAALLAQRVSVGFDADGIVVRDDVEFFVDPLSNKQTPHIKMWYSIPTTERDLSWGLSGRFDGASFFTSSVAEAYLALDELSPQSAIEAKPQLYTAAAFNTRVINFDERSIRKVNTRFAFNVVVNNTKIHGSFRPADLGSMKANPHVSLVVPTYNAQVFDAVAATFNTMLDVCRGLAKAAADPERYPDYVGGANLPAFLERRVARDVLGYAQKISPAFRSEIHRGVMARATFDMTMDQSIQMRARLAQKAFGAYADVLALSLFIEMQGMGSTTTETDDDDKARTTRSFWKDIISDDTMAQVYFETETDRTAVD